MNCSLVRWACGAFVLPLLVLGLSRPLHAQDAPALFKAKCSPCHAADGSGTTSTGKMMKVRDLRSADVQKQTDAELTAVITNGKNKMPAYKGKLDDGQIKGLVGYIRELAKKK